jgi:hypothetical protein
MTVIPPRWCLVPLVLAVGGCRDTPSPGAPAPADPEADIRASLAQLGPDEQRLAEQQRYCPMMEGIRLGAMGRPRTVTVKGVSTFVCCDNCARRARDEPDEAVAKVRELEQARARELSPRSP